MSLGEGLELWRDRLEIEQALYRYARGVDRCDWDMVRSAYHADGTDNHGEFSGSIDQFIAYLRQRHSNIEQSLHFITNILIDFQGETRALVESYYFCQQRLKSATKVEKAFGGVLLGEEETVQTTVSGRYVDHFERRDNRWRIQRRSVLYDVLSLQATPIGGGIPSSLPLSRRDQTDLLYTERVRLGFAD